MRSSPRPEVIEAKVQALNPKISLVYSSYVNNRTICQWIHADYGPFERAPVTLLKSGVGHPREIRDRIEKTNVERHGVPFPMQSKEVMDKSKKTNLEKYGTNYSFLNQEVKEKIKKTNIEKYGSEFTFQSEEVKSKIKKTNLERYGVENSALNNEIKKKTKQTNFERYGAENPFGSSEIQDKIKQTNLEKYGVEYTMQNQEIRDKSRQTNLERYGFEVPTQSPKIQDKAKQINLERYGFEFTFQREEVKGKIKQTNLERYGFEVASQSPEIQDKIKQTNLERYGFEVASQSPEIQARVVATNQERYGGSSPFNSTSVREKSKKTNQERYGADNPFANKEIKKKILDTNMERYGFPVAALSPKIQDKMKQTNIERYGVDNPWKNATTHEKAFFTKKKNGSLFHSKPEKELMEFVKELGQQASPSNIRHNNKNFNLDILIPSKKIAIEFNGLYWHSEANPKIHKNYHLDKTEACKAQGIALIHIWEHEWSNRNQIVKSYLGARLGLNQQRIGARQCTIQAIDKKTGNAFMESNHLLGRAPSSHQYVGLIFDDQIVGVAAFGRHHRNHQQIVLSRISFKSGINVVGGVSRLSSHVVNQVQQDIVTWVELRLSSATSYEAAGWKVESQLPPDYFYINIKTNKVISKQSRKKSNVKTPTGMTERQHAIQDGLRRVYDCGKLKLRFKLN